MNAVKFIFNSTKWNPTLIEWSLAGSLIQSEEQSKIAGFYFKDDAKLALAARLLIRYAIASCTALDWNQIALARTSKGKPILVNKDCSLKFNATHDGDYVAVVADSTLNVGIDIMNLKRKPGNDLNQFFKIMSSKFTENEWSNIYNHSSEHDQLGCFYRHWCLKESYVKAIGDGISYPLRNLDFHISSDVMQKDVVSDTKLLINSNPLQSWIFEETVIDNHCIAVAKERQIPTHCLHFKELTFNDIKKLSIKLCEEQNVNKNFLKSYQKPYKINPI